MKETTRSIAARHIVASLLSSRLSDGEVRELARSIQSDVELWARVAKGLGFVETQREARVVDLRWGALDAHRRHLLETALAAVKKQRLGKHALVDLMRAAEPNRPTPLNPESYSVKDLLAMFLTDATPGGVELMMRRLDRDRPRDAYFDALNDRP